MRLRSWILLGGAFAGLGLAAAATSRKYHTRKIEAETTKNPTAAPSRVEPEGGWRSRWVAREDDALEVCRRDIAVDSWRTAGRCAMDHAFPEGAPWQGDRSTWPLWSRAAQAEVDRSIRERVVQALGDYKPQHWHLDWWLRAHRLPKDTRAVEAARTLWPAESWPATGEDPPWKRAAWALLNRRFESEPVVVG